MATIVEKSQLRSLTRNLANKRRKLVKSPGFNTPHLILCAKGPYNVRHGRIFDEETPARPGTLQFTRLVIMSGVPWNAIGEGIGAAVFLAYGLTRKPLHFNEVNLRKKPLSVLGARLVYIPMGTLLLFFALRDFARAVTR